MTYEVNESYYIKEDALQLLLAGVGMRKWYGMYRGRGKDKVTIEDGHRMLVYLYQENYATWEDGCVQILEPASTLARVIHGAKNCLLIENVKEHITKMCYLHDDIIAVLEYGKQDEDQIRFRICDEESFYTHLWESGVFPNEEIEDEEQNILSMEIENQKIAILKVIDKQNGSEKKTVTVVEEGIYTYLSEWEELKEKKTLYEKETSRDMIKAMFRMEA